MKNLNMKRSKRLTGMVCMMLSIFLLTMPLLGMAAAQDVSGNDAPACICDTKCSVETPNQECPVCKENADACKGQAAEPNTLPCFCEKKCTKGDHNTECPTCAADMDLCTAPPAGEPAACICTVLCQEGAVNPDCAVCQSDRAQCIGKAPDTSTEPEQPTEPDTPTEPEPPAEPEKCTCTDKCAAGAVNTGCEICKNDLTKCEGKEPEVVDPKFTISILAPDGWYTNRANVEMRQEGYEVVQSKKILKFRAQGQERFTRSRILGADYTLEVLQERIGKTQLPRRKKKVNLQKDTRINLLMDIQARLQGRGPGMERWMKIHNLKEAAKTLNYLTEHGITEYDVLASRVETAAADFETVSISIKQMEHRMEQIAALKTHIINYAKTRNTYLAYRKTKAADKPAFRAAHETDLLLHEAAKRAFDALGVKKLPTVKVLQAEYTDLLAKKKAAYEDFKRLRQENQELQAVKSNVDSLLQIKQEEKKEQKQEKKQEQDR